MAKADLIYRYSALDGAKIDRAARTVPVSFSSELPAMQRENGGSSHITGLAKGEIYVEILDHEPENVDITMLNNRGAFLDEHDDKDQIGVIEKAELDPKSKRGLAIVKLSAHEKGMRRFAEMEANDRPHISAGYKYTKLIRSEKLPNGRVALRFAWRGMEISSVAVPNDPSVGVARAYQDLPPVDSLELSKLEREEFEKLKRQKIMPKTAEELATEKAIADATATAVLDATTKTRNETKAAVESAFKSRAKEITAIADEMIKDHGEKDAGEMKNVIRKLANEALLSDGAVNDFKMRCMTDVMKAKPVDPVFIEDCGDPKDLKRFSLMRGIQDCIKNKRATPDGLEGEVSKEYINLCKARDGGLGFTPEGEFLIPAHSRRASVSVDRMTRGERDRVKRDLQATIFAAGGATVPTILMTPIIDLLRNRMVLSEAGVTTMGGLTGNVVIPRLEAPATAYSVSEIQQLTQSQLVLGQIALYPKRVGASTTYSKQWLMQSSPDAEALVRDDAFKVIAMKWDLLGIAGQGGGNEPTGILNSPGVGVVTFGATPTYIKMILFETLIRAQNVTDPLTYLSTPTVKGALKGIAEALTGATTIGGSQNAIWKPDNKINGYPAIDSNQIPLNLVLAGAFSQLIHALWGGLDVVVDYWTLADKAEVKLSINTWGDYAVRHPQAFAISSDSGNQ